MPAFIGTLSMYGVARGTSFPTAGGTTVPVIKLLGVSIPVIVMIMAVVVLHYVLSRTRFGQYTHAIDGNCMAAIRSGINVRRHTMITYLIAAGFAGLAGMIYTSRFSAGAAQAGEPMLLDSIVVAVIAALTIAVIQYGLVFVNVGPFWHFVVVGVVIIVSVLVDQCQSRLRGKARDVD